MSETEALVFDHTQQQETEAPETGLIRRTFAAELTEGDGRTVDVRIVPYGQRIVHNDGHGGVRRGVAYTEEWMPGAFAHQVKAANRVLVNFEHHQEGLSGVIGHGLVLRDAPEAFYGSFKIHDSSEGDRALMLVREGVVGGVSLEARDRKSVRSREGVIQRFKADLRNIALCRYPAYDDAVVLAVREEAIIDEELDTDLLPIEYDPELVERLRAQGIALPDRYTAHPAETDTPAEAGTSEDGTRLQSEEVESSEV